MMWMLVFLFSGTTSAAKAQEKSDCISTPTELRCVQVVDFYDGDSFFVDLPNQHPLFGKRMGVRIKGLDTPELRTKNGCEKETGLIAKRALKKILTSAKRIDLVGVEKDKYFRILATVKADGRDVSKFLIEKGLAFPYFGKKKEKRNWCEKLKRLPATLK